MPVNTFFLLASDRFAGFWRQRNRREGAGGRTAYFLKKVPPALDKRRNPADSFVILSGVRSGGGRGVPERDGRQKPGAASAQVPSGAETGGIVVEKTDLFGTENARKILFRLAPPVMLAQLIQALYNIVDSFFIGRYSDSGLTALSIVYPLQLLMIAFAVGTGVGINTGMAARLGSGDRKEADTYAGVGTPLAVVLWVVFATACYVLMPFYARMSTGRRRLSGMLPYTGGLFACSASGCFWKAYGRRFCRRTAI